MIVPLTRDAAVLDPALGIAARAEAGAGDDFGQPVAVGRRRPGMSAHWLCERPADLGRAGRIGDGTSSPLRGEADERVTLRVGREVLVGRQDQRTRAGVVLGHDHAGRELPGLGFGERTAGDGAQIDDAGIAEQRQLFLGQAGGVDLDGVGVGGKRGGRGVLGRAAEEQCRPWAGRAGRGWVTSSGFSSRGMTPMPFSVSVMTSRSKVPTSVMALVPSTVVQALSASAG